MNDAELRTLAASAWEAGLAIGPRAVALRRGRRPPRSLGERVWKELAQIRELLARGGAGRFAGDSDLALEVLRNVGLSARSNEPAVWRTALDLAALRRERAWKAACESYRRGDSESSAADTSLDGPRPPPEGAFIGARILGWWQAAPDGCGWCGAAQWSATKGGIERCDVCGEVKAKRKSLDEPQGE